MRRRAPRRNSANTRAQILAAAIKEFSAHGFGGARIDRIVARAKCNVRMLYHHFGSKQGLYRAALQASYTKVRAQEAALHLEQLPLLEGMVCLLDTTFEHFAGNPDFVALLNNENLMRGRFVLHMKNVTDITSPTDPAWRKQRRAHVRDVIMAYLTSEKTA